MFFLACDEKSDVSKNYGETQNKNLGQSNVKDDVSDKDIVKIATSSPDHTTLVKALVAAELVDALSNAGPFTVFAPSNSAFDKLPAGTLDDLLKPENKNKLRDILQHHVCVAVYTTDMLRDGLVLSMVDGNSVKVSVKDKTIYIGKARILSSVRASNGIVHIIDEVVLASDK
ncbi:MAG: fasciclin domain-containing protein [Ignavibacteria bacterium]|nr:fasciclin domain-containing protein [Ignavibacteria bacterium]